MYVKTEDSLTTVYTKNIDIGTDLLQPSPKEKGYVFTSVCLAVCPLDYSKS